MDLAQSMKKASMRILVLTDAWFPYLGGGPIHVWEICQRLAKDYSCDITILTRRLPGPSRLVPRDPTRKARVKIIAFGPCASLENMAARLWFLLYAFFKSIMTDCDIVHAHAFSPLFIANSIGKLKGCPVVATIHGTRLLTRQPMGHGMLDNLFYYLEKKLIQDSSYDQVISVDARTANLIVKSPVTVIPNGVTRPHGRSQIRKSKNGKEVLFVGRLVAQKGLSLLVDALVEARRHIPDIRLVIIGNGPLRRSLELHVALKQLTGHVEFHGEKVGEALTKAIRSANVFVLPSLYEGHSLALLTVMAAGLPAIVTDVGGNRDIVIHGKTGYVIPPNDLHALAKTLVAFFRNPNKEKLSIAARDHVRKNYSWEQTAAATHAVYQKVLRQWHRE